MYLQRLYYKVIGFRIRNIQILALSLRIFSIDQQITQYFETKIHESQIVSFEVI